MRKFVGIGPDRVLAGGNPFWKMILVLIVLLVGSLASVAMAEEAMARFAPLPAFRSFDQVLTYGEVERLSRELPESARAGFLGRNVLDAFRIVD